MRKNFPLFFFPFIYTAAAAAGKETVGIVTPPSLGPHHYHHGRYRHVTHHQTESSLAYKSENVKDGEDLDGGEKERNDAAMWL